MIVDKYYAALIGGFPRTRSYANIMSRFLKGKIDRETLYKEAIKQSLKIMKKLTDYGIHVLNDGMYLCDDILNPFTKDIKNVETGWLVRFYENNFFVRNVIIKGKIELYPQPFHILERVRLIEKIREEIGNENIMFRLPVPGPLTFLHYSHKETIYSDKQLIADYTKNVLKKIELLLEKYNIVMEIHDPSMSFYYGNKKLLRTYVKEMMNLNSRHFLINYFGSVPREISRDLGNHYIIGYDLVLGNRIHFIKENKEAQLGILDSQNTMLEDFNDVIGKIRDIENLFEKMYFSTNTLLEFLPEVIAYRKMRLLGRIINKLDSLG